jgi:hypothetical protein
VVSLGGLEPKGTRGPVLVDLAVLGTNDPHFDGDAPRSLRMPVQCLPHKARRCVTRGLYAAGRMFWFTRKKFPGSYFALMAASRS